MSKFPRGPVIGAAVLKTGFLLSKCISRVRSRRAQTFRPPKKKMSREQIYSSSELL